jgi:hypothetical protein
VHRLLETDDGVFPLSSRMQLASESSTASD